MSLDNLYYIWLKTAFLIVHRTTIWVLLVFFATSLTAWLLAASLDRINTRAREANLARLTAKVYTGLALTLWFFSFVFS